MQSLSPEIAARIQQKLDTHLYPSPDDVMRHALDALDDWQAYERREVLKGREQAQQGDIAPLDMAEIIREAREQWDEQHP
jgi:Arc/MetJ-type ribon-helix-helix transcriptional regulator